MLRNTVDVIKSWSAMGIDFFIQIFPIFQISDFLIFYKYFNRKIKFSEKISSSVFQLQMRDGLFHPFGGGGACEDLDAIDVIYKTNSGVNTESEESLKRHIGRCYKISIRMVVFVGLKDQLSLF